MDKEKPICPICRTNERVKKNGTFRDKQRYLCCKCSKSFSPGSSRLIVNDAATIIDAWVKGSENLNQVAGRNNISRYYIKKIILCKYTSELEETKQQIAELKKTEQNTKDRLGEYRQQMETEPKSSYGKRQELKYKIEESKDRLKKETELLTKAICRMEELKACSSSYLSVTKINFSKYKKLLRKSKK